LEAITRKKEVDEMKTLTKEHGLFQVNIAGGVATQTDFSQGYRLVDGTTGFFVSENYFDLAGMTLEEKTLFFEGATVQNLNNPSYSAGVAGESVQVIDIMSSVPLPDTVLDTYFVDGNFASSGSPTFEQTIYARNTFHVIDVDFAAAGYFNTLFSNQIGSLMPTASDRVYTYRLIGITPTQVTPAIISVWPCRYILRASAKEEAEYEYIMRLKRSYDLQQRFDRD
jgi:hypothetical protein